MIVFDHIPKTAGTTLKFILRNNFGMFHCDTNLSKKDPFTNRELELAKKLFFSIKSISGHNLKNPTHHITGEKCFYITILRDPIKRCVSHFQDDCLRRGNTLPLNEWIKNKKLHNLQVKYIAGEENLSKTKKIIKDEFSFVGITEKFDESLQLFKTIYSQPLNINYKKMIIAKDNKIKNNILNDPELVEIVKKYNQLDLKLYNYVLQEIFPKRKNRIISKIDNIPLKKKSYKNVITFNYQMSIFYNKFIYKIILKLIGKRK